MAAAIGINVVAPPRHDQPTLLQKFRFVDVRGVHTVRSLWFICLSMAAPVHNLDSSRALQAMVLKPWPHTSLLVS